MAEKDLMAECVCYFAERSVYKKLFAKVCEKYNSLGHLGGSVILSGISLEEKEQLSGFFQKDFSENKSITISVKLMEKALSGSKFSKLKWLDILENYYGEALSTKKELQSQSERIRNEFFQELLEKYRGSIGAEWLERCLQEKQEGYQLLMLQYREQRQKLKSTLDLLLAGIPELPIVLQGQKNDNVLRRIAIPIFAAQVSGNPHFFDSGTLPEKLLILFIKDYFQIVYSSRERILEEKKQLLYDSGLLRDDLSNYTLTYGIMAEDFQGESHKGIQGFGERKEPVQLTLLTVSRLAKAYPQVGRRVYIVENPTVFAALTEAFQDITLICGNGQIRLATLALLDLFAEDIEFWYAGDFDPEGLLIAQRLRKRYGKRLRFWNYKKYYYESHLSNERLDVHRQKKLERIDEEELFEIRDAMYKHECAVYQELMIQEYLNELMNCSENC